MKKAITILLLAIIAFSCNPTKRLERKTEKVWDWYVTSPVLISRSVPLVKALHPSAFEIVRSDTEFISEPKPYPVLVETKVPYTVYKDKILDTIINDISVFADSTGIMVKYIGKPKVIIKQIKEAYKDVSEVNRLNDSLNNSKVKEAQLKGQITQLEKDNAELKADKKKSDIKFYSLIGLIAIIISVIVFVKVKTKLPI